MKTNRVVLAPVMLALAGALAWGVGERSDAASTTTSVQASVNGAVGSSDLAQAQSSSTETLTGASTERVTFSGKAVIKAKVIEDPDFRTAPIVVLSVDMSGISGVGETSRKKYVTTNKTVIQRRLRASDSIAVTFPFWPSGTSATGTGPVGVMSIALTYDVNNRKLTAAAGSVISP